MTNPYDPQGVNPSDPYQGQSFPGQVGQDQPFMGHPYSGQPYAATGPTVGSEPDNNLVWAILSTILCCLPLGIVAIVKSTSVSKLWAQGDAVGAQKAADDAKKFAIWGLIAAVIPCCLYLIFFVVSQIMGTFSS